MKKIQELVDHIDEELEGAKCYAEKYLEYKADGNGAWANRYREMAQDELKHAGYIHEIAVTEIENLRKVYTPPIEMQEKWDEEHKKYVGRSTWIKQMLAM